MAKGSGWTAKGQERVLRYKAVQEIVKELDEANSALMAQTDLNQVLFQRNEQLQNELKEKATMLDRLLGIMEKAPQTHVTGRPTSIPPPAQATGNGYPQLPHSAKKSRAG